MSAATKVSRALDHWTRGLLSNRELSEALYLVFQVAARDEDPEFSDALLLAAKAPEPDGALIHWLSSWSRHLVRADDLRSWSSRPIDEARSAITQAVACRLASLTDPTHMAELVAGLPSEWVTREMLVRVLDACTEESTLLEVLLTLFEVLRRHESDAGFSRIAIEPYLSAPGPTAAALIARGYLQLSVDARTRNTMRASLIDHRDRLDAHELLTLAVRFSIEVRDESAVRFAREWIARGAVPESVPIAALILWIAGHREEAAEAATRFEPDPQGWYSQAAQSLYALLRAVDAPPSESLQWITQPTPTGGLWRQAPSVGALVGRLAFLRMQAHAERGEFEDATREAHAVVLSYGYCAYDLHMQVPDQEFDVRLVDRLRVNPDEVRDARAMIAAHPDAQDPMWFLMEGSLLRRV